MPAGAHSKPRGRKVLVLIKNTIVLSCIVCFASAQDKVLSKLELRLVNDSIAINQKQGAMLNRHIGANDDGLKLHR